MPQRYKHTQTGKERAQICKAGRLTRHRETNPDRADSGGKKNKG